MRPKESWPSKRVCVFWFLLVQQSLSLVLLKRIMEKKKKNFISDSVACMLQQRLVVAKEFHFKPALMYKLYMTWECFTSVKM